jgi:uncharacterized membrane protein
MSAAAADQNSSVRKIVLVVVALGVVSMLSLIVAGATSLISLAERIHPVAGTIAFWSICLAAGFFALYCLITYGGCCSTCPAQGNLGTQARRLLASVAFAPGD